MLRQVFVGPKSVAQASQIGAFPWTFGFWDRNPLHRRRKCWKWTKIRCTGVANRWLWNVKIMKNSSFSKSEPNSVQKRPFWHPFGLSWDSLGPSWDSFRPFWGILGVSWGSLGGLRACFGASWGIILRFCVIFRYLGPLQLDFSVISLDFRVWFCVCVVLRCCCCCCCLWSVACYVVVFDCWFWLLLCLVV